MVAIRGLDVPYFIHVMVSSVISAENIKEILEDILKQKDLLLVDIVVTRTHKIMLYIDRQDRGVTVDDCAEINRAVGAKLSRYDEDYELEVSSPGPDRSLLLPRQYGKHIGREVYITTNEGKSYTGRLSSVNGETIVIVNEQRVKDEKTGKRVPALIRNELLTGNIKKAKILFSK